MAWHGRELHISKYDASECHDDQIERRKEKERRETNAGAKKESIPLSWI
jgi:hypothetical protein